MLGIALDPRRGRWLALGLITFTRASMGYQFQAVASTAPQLRADFGLDNAFIGTLVGLYLLPGLAFAFPGGVLGKRFGDRRIVLSGLVLMSAGALLMSFAESAAMLTFGRLVAGAGGVLLNVLLAKMVADWFEGREIFLAMSTMINAWPIGIALALMTLGPVSVALSWQAAMLLTAAAAGIAFVAFALFYRNAPRIGSNVATMSDLLGMPRRELLQVTLAGGIWSVFNAALAVQLAFLASHLVDRGLGFVEASLVMSVWMVLAVVAVQAGGMLVQRFGRATMTTVLGFSAGGASLALLPWLPWPVAILFMTALLSAAPAGVLIAQPAMILSSAHRAPGMGVFYTIYYVGMAALPPFAGWLFDLSGTSAAPVFFAGAAVFLCAPAFLLLRRWVESSSAADAQAARAPG